MDAFPVLFAAVIAFLLYRYFRYGSIGGVLLGSRVGPPLGEVVLRRGRFTSTILRIQAVGEDGQDDGFALSVVSKAPLGASMVPIRLTRDQAQDLVQLLAAAVSAGTATAGDPE